jgi:hypothetical protein
VFNAAPVGGRFDPNGPCPQLKRDEDVRAQVAAKQARDDARVAELSAQGVRPIRTVYADGGQHPSFASLSAFASRPEALARGPVDVALDDAAGRKARVSPVVQVAAAKSGPAAVRTVAANAKLPDATDVTGSIAKAPAKEAEKPWMFARFFGPKAPDSEAPASASDAAAPAANGAPAR